MSNHVTKTVRVACAIIKRDDLVFIARRRPEKSQGGKWEFPGGKVEEGETVQECLKREFFEEFGISIQVGDLCGTNVHAYDSITIELIGIYSTMNNDTFTLVDHDKTAWVHSKDLKNYDLAPADIPLIHLIH